jgi:hypothetical protein
MSGPDPLGRPEDLRELDRALAGIRFTPREGFGAELAGRAARGQAAPPMRARRRIPLAAALCVAAVVLVSWAAWNARPVTIDRCCYDLDGGIERDDGVLVITRRSQDVRRLAVYEDRDGSRSYTAGDLLRFSRGSAPTLLDAEAADLVTTRHCCIDFDGGGPDDDGLLVVGVPPDRVMMVALYEQSPDRVRSGWLLR